jgi:hypothetical protein
MRRLLLTLTFFPGIAYAQCNVNVNDCRQPQYFQQQPIQQPQLYRQQNPVADAPMGRWEANPYMQNPQNRAFECLYFNNCQN